MCRWMSRITLDIVSVRVERLNAISEADAIAEGIESTWSLDCGGGWKNYSGGDSWQYPVASYRSLWESINGLGSWIANPWVWAIEFKRMEQEQ